MPTCYRHPERETYIRCQRCDRSICPDCMHEAAVGFHCPHCVAEGRRATRSGRTAYGGLRSANPALTSLVLIGLNVAVWVAVLATGWRDSRLVHRLALVPEGLCTSRAEPGGSYPSLSSAEQCGMFTATPGDGLWVPGVAEGSFWQLATSAFAHVQPWHIGFNMLALWILGPQLEAVLGRARFLALYLLAALAGSVLVLWLADPQSATLGASGAIFGLLGALLVVALKVGGDVRGLMVWLALNAVITVAVPHVSWQGHLGGFVGGAAVAALVVLAPKGPRRSTVQYAGLAAIGVLLGLGILTRVLVLG